MKPRFALVLSLEQVALLHRQKRGWEVVGAVALGDPDFGGRIAALREAALALSPEGIETKLILPETQVLYTAIASPGRDDNARREAIRRALDGMTPYAVDELAFDYEAEGEMLHVAVVARETLEEAEEFAVGHGLNPVSIVARPRGGSFTGEPFFGETAVAAAILPPGERVERDVLPTLATLKLTRGGAAPAAQGVDTAAPRTRDASAGGEAAADTAAAAGSAGEAGSAEAAAPHAPEARGDAAEAGALLAAEPDGTAAEGPAVARSPEGTPGEPEAEAESDAFAAPATAEQAASAGGWPDGAGEEPLPVVAGPTVRTEDAMVDPQPAGATATADIGDEEAPFINVEEAEDDFDGEAAPASGGTAPDAAETAAPAPVHDAAAPARDPADLFAEVLSRARGQARPAPEEFAGPALPPDRVDAAGGVGAISAAAPEAEPAEVARELGEPSAGGEGSLRFPWQSAAGPAGRAAPADAPRPDRAGQMAGGSGASADRPPPPRGAGPLPGVLKVGITSGELPPVVPVARPVVPPGAGSRTARARVSAIAQAPASLRKVLARPRPVTASGGSAAEHRAATAAVPPRRRAAARRSPLMAFVLATGLVAVIAAVGLWSALFNRDHSVPESVSPGMIGAAPDGSLPPIDAIGPRTAGDAIGRTPGEGAPALAPPTLSEAMPVAPETPSGLTLSPSTSGPLPAEIAAIGAAGTAATSGAGAAAGGAAAAIARAAAAAASAGAGRPPARDTVASGAEAFSPAPAGADIAPAEASIWTEPPEAPDPLAEGGASSAVRSAVDPRLPEDAPEELAREGLSADAAPPPAVPAPPPGTVIAFGPDGLVLPTPEGTPTPDGAVVRLGRPPLVPPGRSAVLAFAAGGPADAITGAPADEAASEGAVAAAPMLEIGGTDAPGSAPPVAPAPETAAQSAVGSTPGVTAEAASQPGAGEPFALPGTPSTPPRPRPAGFLATVPEAPPAEAPAIEAATAGPGAAEGQVVEPPPPAATNPLAGVRPRPRPFAPDGGGNDAAVRPAAAEGTVAALAGQSVAAGAAAGASAEATPALPGSGAPGSEDAGIVAAAALRPATDTAVAALKPRARPGTVPPAAEPAASPAVLGPPVADPALAGFRPRARPAVVLAAISPAAPAAAEPAAPPSSFAGASELAVAVAPIPRNRPRDFAERAQIAAAAAAAARAVASAPPPPEPPPPAAAPAPAPAAAPAPPAAASAPDNRTVEIDPEAEADGEVEVAVAAVPAGGPRLPTRASVAEQATVENAIRLNRLNLIGIYGGARDRRALVRLPSGRYVKVQVGDRVDGGRVAAITERELQLVKGGRNIVLRVGEGG